MVNVCADGWLLWCKDSHQGKFQAPPVKEVACKTPKNLPAVENLSKQVCYSTCLLSTQCSLVPSYGTLILGFREAGDGGPGSVFTFLGI